MLKDAVEAERAERDQDADCARIDAAIALVEQDIAALEDRQLGDEMRKQWFAIRDRTILAIRDVRNNIVKRANEAKATEQWMIEKLMREGSDERVLREFSITLKEVPTKELVDYLRYLVQIGDRARAFKAFGWSLQRETTVRHMMSASARCWRNLHWPKTEISGSELPEFVVWLRR